MATHGMSFGDNAKFVIVDSEGSEFDLTRLVKSVEINYEYPDEVYEFETTRRLQDLPTQTITVEWSGRTDWLELRTAADALLRQGWAPTGLLGSEPQPVVEEHVTHTFAQDLAEPRARLCAVEGCGMWPEHHNHGERRHCVCADCQPDADDLEEYAEDHGVTYDFGANEDDLRSHP